MMVIFLILLIAGVNILMSTVTDVQTDLAAVKTDVARVVDLVASLKASQGAATQADVDAVDAQVKDLQAAVAAIV